MKTITHVYYQAEDGRTFDDPEKCKQYEADGCVLLKSLPKYRKHHPLDDKYLYLAGGDGDCYYATATHYSDETVHRAPHPEWATHIIYFGK